MLNQRWNTTVPKGFSIISFSLSFPPPRHRRLIYLFFITSLIFNCTNNIQESRRRRLSMVFKDITRPSGIFLSSSSSPSFYVYSMRPFFPPPLRFFFFRVITITIIIRCGIVCYCIDILMHQRVRGRRRRNSKP